MPGQADIAGSFSLDRLRQDLEGQLHEALRPLGGLGRMLFQRPFDSHSRHTTRVLILTPAGRPAAVLICSPALQPDYVERAVARTRQAREVLGPEIGKPVLLPLIVGRYEGLSYALWPYRFPLSDRRGFWWLQRHWLRPRLFHWLRETTRLTLHAPSAAGVESDFVVPLQALIDSQDVSARIREQAKAATERLLAGTWQPVHVFEHNDLWKGNILLNTPMTRCLLSSPADGVFSIIDWLGAKANGHGFFDLVRLAQSMQLPRGQLAAEVESHCRILGCNLADVRGYVLASLGHLRLNLEGFPVERFGPLAQLCCHTLDLVVEETD